MRRNFTGKSGESHLCYKCIEAKPAYEKARSVFELNDLLLHIIHRYKYNGDLYLAKPLAALLLAGYWMHWQGSEPDIFIPIPLHRKKAFKRGYNQSYILLKEMMNIGKKLELPIKRTQLNAFSVERKRNTISQTGLSREKRKENMKNAFHVIKKEEIDQKKVLLIDDVMTTGATVDMCANSLLAAGAASVEVLTLAELGYERGKYGIDNDDECSQRAFGHTKRNVPKNCIYKWLF